MKNVEKGLMIYEQTGNKKGVGNSYMSIALIYSDQGYFEQALEYHYKSLKICEETGNKEGMAKDLGYIGNIFYYQDN